MTVQPIIVAVKMIL